MGERSLNTHVIGQSARKPSICCGQGITGPFNSDEMVSVP